MSRSEKDNPWLKAMGIESSPAYTGECGCKYCCTGIKRAVKRQDHKAERRAAAIEIRFQLDAEDAETDRCPYLEGCDCRTYVDDGLPIEHSN